MKTPTGSDCYHVILANQSLSSSWPLHFGLLKFAPFDIVALPLIKKKEK